MRIEHESGWDYVERDGEAGWLPHRVFRARKPRGALSGLDAARDAREAEAAAGDVERLLELLEQWQADQGPLNDKEREEKF